MKIKALAGALFIISLIAYGFNHVIGSLLLFISTLLFIKPISDYLSEYTYGVEFKFPKIDEEEGQGIYIIELGKGRYKVGTALKILEVNYGVHDMDEASFLGLSKEVIDGIIVDYDVDYKMIYIKNGNDIRYYIQVGIDGEDLSTLRNRLLYTVRNIKRVLENAGVRCAIASAEDLKYPINIKPSKPKRILQFSLLVIGLLLMYKGFFPDFIHLGLILDIFIIGLIFLIISLSIRRRNRKYMIEDGIVTVKEDLGSYRAVDPTEIYNNARNLHNMLNKSPYDVVLAISIKPVTSGEYEKIVSKHYTRLKWGEALGRYEWLDESRKVKGLIERKEGGEMLYKFLITIYTNKNLRGLMKSIFESLGFNAKIPITVNRYINIY